MFYHVHVYFMWKSSNFLSLYMFKIIGHHEWIACFFFKQHSILLNEKIKNKTHLFIINVMRWLSLHVSFFFKGFTIRNTRVHHMSERANENTVEHHWTFCRRAHKVDDWWMNWWMDFIRDRRCHQVVSRQADRCGGVVCCFWMSPLGAKAQGEVTGMLEHKLHVVHYHDHWPW